MLIDAYRYLEEEGTDDQHDDILPPAVPFAVAGASLGILVIQGFTRTCLKREVANKLINGSVTEFLIVIGLNALVMGITQSGGIWILSYALLGIAGTMYIRDIVSAHAYSQELDILEDNHLQKAFPRFLFTDSFRDNYIQEMSRKVDSLTADNVYGDFCGNKYRRVLLLAIGQLALLAMFIAGLVLRGSPPFSHKRAYTFYWIGILVEACYVAGKSQFETAFTNYAFFVNTLRAARSNNKVCVIAGEGGMEQYPLLYNDYKLWGRFLLAMAVNNTGFLLIMLVLPMQLSWSSEPTEFVLNAVAAFFIIELDDLSNPVEYKVVDANKVGKESSTTIITERGEPEIDLSAPSSTVPLSLGNDEGAA